MVLVVATVLVWHRYNACRERNVRSRHRIRLAAHDSDIVVAVWAHNWCICSDDNDRGQTRRKRPMETLLEPQLERPVAYRDPAVLSRIAPDRQSRLSLA